MSVLDIKNKEEFAEYERNQNLVVFHFMADWAPQCGQMNEVLTELAKQEQLKEVIFAKILAEEIPEISSKYEITAVPTFIFLRDNVVIERIDGANAADLTSKVKAQASKVTLLSMVPTKPKETLNERLKQLINSHKCMLFMKGSPEMPKCGFSKTTVELLRKYNTEYSHFDILTNEEVRQGLKSYSNWPTYPQIYLDGDLIGGLDILKELDESGELENMLPKKVDLEARLKSLINSSDLMLFMKGNREEPRCGFSRQLIEILNETGLEYNTFDILSDEEVRQGLKKFSDWPTYPQVYVKGELIGGLDIVKELKADSSLISTLKGE
ncbi:UNVERIFIED_CONTAM: hypothetical protein RMT77_007720 [Armadillidium vulgare]